MSNVTSSLVLNTSAFSAGIKSAEKGLQTLKGGVMGVKGLLVTAFAAITTGAAAMKLKEIFDLGDSLNELSSATATSVKDLMILQKAFSISGVEADKVAPAIAKMRKGIAEAAGGGASRDTFKKLGLSIKDLGSLNAEGQMKAIGEAIMGVKNPTERTAMAMAVFGKSGQELLRVFSTGAIAQTEDSIGAKADILDKNSAVFADISCSFLM